MVTVVSAAEVGVRAVAYAAAMFLFGASLFLNYVPRQALRAAQDAGLHEWRALRRHVLRLQIACVVATIVSSLVWLAIHAAVISDLPIAQAVTGPAAGAVLRDTLFGRMTALRLLIALVAAAMLVPGRRVLDVRAPAAGDIARTALAGGLLATMAWMGHAAATPGQDGSIHLCADLLHLLAAGAWLGALPPLALMLVRAARAGTPAAAVIAARATRQFSTVAIACVGALLVTGGLNAWYLVGTPAALFGTPYGQLLLLKLALFVLMVALAAGNRFRLMPRVAAAAEGTADPRTIAAMRRIARNARIEAASGLAIALIVGALGIAIPGAHTEIVWPLSFAIDFGAVDEHGEPGLAPVELLLVCIGAVVVAVRAARRGQRAMLAASSSVGAAALVLCGYLVIVPAYPTTYARSPLRYTASSIAAGAALYAAHCAVCHGADGYGEGPAAASLPVRPANLTAAHALHHRPGEIFWRLTHGIPGTPMPGFANALTPTQMWQLVGFLRARADSEAARNLTASVEKWQPIAAPDFTFEIGRGDQETLEGQRGRDAVLLVVYTLPASQARLAVLAAGRSRLASAGIRVIALPCPTSASAAKAADGVDPAMLAIGDASVVTAYALFLNAPARLQRDSTCGHAEFLVDRNGYLRALHAGLDEPTRDRVVDLLQDADRLHREPPRPPALAAHLH